MRAVGCDPGIRGGIAVVDITDAGIAVLVDTIDIPTVGVGAGERVDVAAIRDWIARHQPAFAYVERAQAMPRQGSSSGFKYGRSVGAIEAAIVLSAVPLQIVEPTAWKRFWKLPAKEKERSRQRALELFPAAHALLSRRRDHGRAESALIAVYGARMSTAPTTHDRISATVPTVSESGSAT